MDLATWHNGTPGEIVVSGEIDLSVAPLFQEALVAEATGNGAVRVDVAGVTFIDSTGLHALVNARAAVKQLVIQRPTKAVLRLLEITGTTELFTIEQYDDATRQNDRCLGRR